mmetsp:Transcript_33060/g.87417  ORF Transcript_33060/g.87417 Transcript_33060/m.87417 type:complete len:88 (+) Transcript_33060:1415-1678(+)
MTKAFARACIFVVWIAQSTCKTRRQTGYAFGGRGETLASRNLQALFVHFAVLPSMQLSASQIQPLTLAVSFAMLVCHRTAKRCPIFG